jgi:hypothetical protein
VRFSFLEPAVPLSLQLQRLQQKFGEKEGMIQSTRDLNSHFHLCCERCPVAMTILQLALIFCSLNLIPKHHRQLDPPRKSREIFLRLNLGIVHLEIANGFLQIHEHRCLTELIAKVSPLLFEMEIAAYQQDLRGICRAVVQSATSP